MTSVVPTVNAINGILDRFGFLRFSLAADPARQGTYRIIRSDGSDASKTLSEGEYTFISFLYFYHLCFGSHEGSGLFQNKILVIDDPISSLDSSVLFVVATLVKDIIAKCRKDEAGIKQVVILTHNIHFHKEITYLGMLHQKRTETLIQGCICQVKVDTIKNASFWWCLLFCIIGAGKELDSWEHQKENLIASLRRKRNCDI